MSVQDEAILSDASARIQSRSRILTPASDSSLNTGEANNVVGRKRKRDGITMEDLLKDSFAVKPYPSAAFVKARTLHPLMLLPRSQLPLSSLDISFSSPNALPQSRLFETHVKILELESRIGSQPMVLVARLDDGRALYAVERESRGLYVILRIGTWVNVQQLQVAATLSIKEPARPTEFDHRVETYQHEGLVPVLPSENNNFSKKKRQAIEAIQSMVKRTPTDPLAESQPTTPLGLETMTESQQEETQQLDFINEEHTQAPADANSPPTAAEIFENVRTQYFETLYLSKASLAYFAKGPLSRARAAFHLDYDSTLDLNDYIGFLESLVLSSNLVDKKYRDGIPECVSLIDIQENSADDGLPTGAKQRKRKSSKKMRPGKNGLYPLEDGLIRRWWASHDDDAESGAPGSSKDEVIKSRISQLRVRETQLQMVVILEVLALQPLASTVEDAGGEFPTTLPTTELMESKDKISKARKPDHLSLLIDVHIDRLCIWQSIAMESIKGLQGDSQNGTENQPRHTDNFLRDFCVEVIAPFFQARLPERCTVINRKLGGPVVVSPPKPRLLKSASFSGGPARPGAATKRPVPRRSLKRVLTNDRERRSMSTGPNRAMSLMRSATMPMIPGLKREASEAPSLSGIPKADSQIFESSRGAILKSKRFAQREVDMSSLVPESNTKATKQAKIDAELKDAIAALKKPNRELAGKALAETAEQRSSSASTSRKSKKPIRNPLFQGVQISATPRANRQKDAFSGIQRPGLPRMADEIDLGVTHPSSVPRIPQSSQPYREVSAKNPFLFSSIQATPTRKASRAAQNEGVFLGISGGNPGNFLPSSPLHVRRSSAQLFPTVPESAVKERSQDDIPSGIQETPVKQRPSSRLDHSHPNSAASSREVGGGLGIGSAFNDDAGKLLPALRKEESIYESLGWDDVNDIDDLA